MNSEQIIKQALDGHFWSLAPSGDRICHTRVPHDYIPDHKPSYDSEGLHEESGRKGGLARTRPWTREEDDRLIALRAKGLRWQVIAYELGRGDKNTRLRYFEVCDERDLKPAPCVKHPPIVLTDDMKASIVHLREQKGWGFKEINAELGLSGFYARDYYTRYKRARYHEARAMKEAA